MKKTIFQIRKSALHALCTYDSTKTRYTICRGILLQVCIILPKNAPFRNFQVCANRKLTIDIPKHFRRGKLVRESGLKTPFSQRVPPSGSGFGEILYTLSRYYSARKNREETNARVRIRAGARPLKTRRGYVTALAVAARSPTTFLYGKDGSEIATTRIWVSMHCGATLLTQSAAPRRSN